MRCEKCGADIGRKRVCPFCSTPIKNVLVGQVVSSFTDLDNVKTKYVDVEDADQTSVMTSAYNQVGLTTVMTNDSISEYTSLNDSGFKEQIVVENGKEFAKKHSNRKKMKKKFDKKVEKKTDIAISIESVIPDFYDDERKVHSKKFKIITASIVFVVILLIAVFTVGYISIKKYKTYVMGLRDVKVEFYEEDARVTPKLVIWEEIKDDGNSKLKINSTNSDYCTEITVPEYKKFVVSTMGSYGAFETIYSYDRWVEDNSDKGKHLETVFVYDLYLVTQFGEKIKVFNSEKLEGDIVLLGVTENGYIIYTDTEAGSSFGVSKNARLSFEVEIDDLLSYQDDTYIILDTNSQLLIKKDGQSDTEISDEIISSGVEKWCFLDSKGEYGILKEVEGVVSTDSLSRTITYEGSGKVFMNDLTAIQDAVPFLSSGLITDDKTYMNNELEVIDMKKQNLNGKGELSINKKGILYYNQGLYRRKLASADEVIALVGTKAYYMFDGKMYIIDVFSKDNHKLYDHKMKVILGK